MFNKNLNINHDLFNPEVELKSTKDGFGEGLLDSGRENEDILALCADFSESTRTSLFEKEFPKRFIQTGIAEQNMIGISAGLAMAGKIPFTVSHAIFNPGRNWDQIRLSVCASNLNVKIVGTHAGFSNGPDGISGEPLEDISLMRVLPNMVVINPLDFYEAKRAVQAAVAHNGPVYLRFYKAPTPVITSQKTSFEIGKAQVLWEGGDLTILSTGPITFEALVAAKELEAKHKISTEVISVSTIKPLDKETILKSVKKTNKCITLEEHQVNGGFGGAVAELLSQEQPTKMRIIGVRDTFAESGQYVELKDKYGLSSHHIVQEALKFLG